MDFGVEVTHPINSAMVGGLDRRSAPARCSVAQLVIFSRVFRWPLTDLFDLVRQQSLSFGLFEHKFSVKSDPNQRQSATISDRHRLVRAHWVIDDLVP